MNRRMIFNTLGKIISLEAVLMILPLAVAMIYNESSWLAFLITIAIAAVLGGAMMLFSKPRDSVIYAKEGFITVALSWIALSLIGALPFFISGEIPSYVDAVFETVSGFTTTGASILTNVEAMGKGMLFWRSFTHWMGGMGILVFVMAIIPNISERSIHILRAEVPGPVVGKLVPRIKDTAKILYLIYLVMTCVEIVLLIAGGMPIFDSIVHSFGTAGTGGFGIKADSIGSYSSYLQWVIAIFMLIFGINFNLYYLVLVKKFRTAIKSMELWTYIGIILVSTVIIAFNIYPTLNNVADTLLHSFFQVSSLITTTGYATQNFDLWPSLSKAVLLILMFVGGCAGSTAGGFKVSRVVIIFKKLKSEFKRLLHPRSVKVITFEGKKVEEQTVNSVFVYLGIYMICLLATFLFISVDGFSMETNFSAAVSCFNNIGPAFGKAGPALSYAEYSVFSKIVLTISMLLGRLEIFPILIFLTPTSWTKKS